MLQAVCPPTPCFAANSIFSGVKTARADVKEALLVDLAGALLSTISLASLIAGAADSGPFAVIPVCTANHPDALAGLIFAGTHLHAA